MGCKSILFSEKANKKKMFKDWEFNVSEKKNHFKMSGRFNSYKFDRRLITQKTFMENDRKGV